MKKRSVVCPNEGLRRLTQDDWQELSEQSEINQSKQRAMRGLCLAMDYTDDDDEKSLIKCLDF